MRIPPRVARTGLSLVALLALACGSRGGASAPTPSPDPTPRPTPGCGNGIVDPGEFCDGQEFCSECGLSVGGCCEISLPDDGTRGCLATGIAAARPCLEIASGNFSIGTTCEGEPCGIGDTTACHRSPCRDTAIAPVSVCCEPDEGGCDELLAETVSELATFAIFDCSATRDATAVLGNCRDGRCVPGP